MNILVCLKLISQAQFTDLLNDSEDRLSGGDLSLNPVDLYALELALRNKEKHAGTVVTVVSMAPAFADHFLREAIAMGADHAVLVTDNRMAGSDTLVTARILAAAIRRLPQPDLILCGKKALDSETGHIGPQLATLLSLPLATNVMEFSVAGKSVKILRAGDVGQYRYKGCLPCILTICNGNEMVRKPTILGLRKSRRAEITVLNLANLELNPEEVGVCGSPTRTISVSNIRFRQVANRMVMDTESGVKEILELSRGRAVQSNE